MSWNRTLESTWFRDLRKPRQGVYRWEETTWDWVYLANVPWVFGFGMYTTGQGKLVLGEIEVLTFDEIVCENNCVKK